MMVRKSGLTLAAGLVFASAAVAQPDFPTTAFDLDVSQIRTCAYDKYYEDALACIGKVADKCFNEGYDAPYESGAVCERREWLAWDVYRQSQLTEARDRLGDTGPAREGLEASATAFILWRKAECDSERAAWPAGFGEDVTAYESCMLRLTAQRAVFVGVKGVP